MDQRVNEDEQQEPGTASGVSRQLEPMKNLQIQALSPQLFPGSLCTIATARPLTSQEPT